MIGSYYRILLIEQQCEYKYSVNVITYYSSSNLKLVNHIIISLLPGLNLPNIPDVEI